MTGAEIQATARELAGRQVDDVRYYTLPYGMTDTPVWDRDVAHTLDYGIDLVTSGGTIGVTWSQYGAFGYGLHLVHGPLLTGLSRAEFCSVADRPPWGAVLGEAISGTRLHWLDVTWGNQETTGPVALPISPVRRQHQHHAHMRVLERSGQLRFPDRRRHPRRVAARNDSPDRALPPSRSAQLLSLEGARAPERQVTSNH
jgi:hypothetical protein